MLPGLAFKALTGPELAGLALGALAFAGIALTWPANPGGIFASESSVVWVEIAPPDGKGLTFCSEPDGCWLTVPLPTPAAETGAALALADWVVWSLAGSLFDGLVASLEEGLDRACAGPRESSAGFSLVVFVVELVQFPPPFAPRLLASVTDGSADTDCGCAAAWAKMF